MTLFPRSPAAAGGSARSADRTAGSPDALSAQGRREFLLRRAQTLVRAYPRPFTILLLLPFSLALDAWHDGFGDPLALFLIAIGATPLARDTIIALRHRRYALDYLALLAIAAAVAAIQFQVGAVIALMLASGKALEDYGVRRARNNLSLLTDRIPRTALVIGDGEVGVPLPVEEITIGSMVMVRHGEVLPLDGELRSERALVDESSLTGEPYLREKARGDEVRSGTVNQGPPLTLEVRREARDSTYRQILALVAAAQEGDAPMVRLADRYSLAFSAVAITLAATAWWWSGSLDRALAVLVVATPCPLILAVPIALMGGVNRAARDKIIVKRLAALEVLARVTYLMLDKTGTITVGRPELVRIETAPGASVEPDRALALAAAVERHSLHPIAKALVDAAQVRAFPILPCETWSRSPARGIEALVEGTRGAGAWRGGTVRRDACGVRGRPSAGGHIRSGGPAQARRASGVRAHSRAGD